MRDMEKHLPRGGVKTFQGGKIILRGLESPEGELDKTLLLWGRGRLFKEAIIRGGYSSRKNGILPNNEI